MRQIEANQPQSLDVLLQSWEEKGDSEEHLETWKFLHQALDEIELAIALYFYKPDCLIRYWHIGNGYKS